jgi:hypothetical protein
MGIAVMREVSSTPRRLLDAGFQMMAVDASRLPGAEGAAICCSPVFGAQE